MTLLAVISASISWLWTQVSSCWNNRTTLAISLILLALLLDHVKRRKRCSRYPPGPAPLPFIGNLLLIDAKKPHKVVRRLEKTFGPAVSFQAGWANYVILSGFKMIKEALGQKTKNFFDRPPVPLLKILGRGKNCEGIIFATSSNGWKEQRRFVLSILKNFCMEKKSLEKITSEAQYLCSEFKSKEGSLFDPQNLISMAVGNIICTLTFGDRFEYTDETFQKLVHLIEEITKGLTKILPQLLAAGSWLSYFPGPHRKVQKLWDGICVITREIVNEHKKTRDPTFPRDLIDAFLDEIEKAKGNPESSFNEPNLMNIIFELFSGGTKTNSAIILWGLLNLVIHPDIQERIHEEMDKVIGRVKTPMMEDQLNLPYTSAVIHEIQRFSAVLPILLPFTTHEDTEVGEFVIPKDTIVFNHLASVLKDETVWEKPHEFYPEHFLDENGQFVKREAFLPFSIGRRSCPGEQLAKTELFIFFTSLLQHFTICIPENCPRPKEENTFFALAAHPPPFQICAIPR